MEKLLKIPYTVFNKNWNLLQQFLDRRGNPKYELVGDVKLLNRKDIFDLGNLVRVYGDLDLFISSIQSLGSLEYVGGDLNLNATPIQSLGSLEYVGGDLTLDGTPIQTLGSLRYVGGDLDLRDSPIESLEDLEYVGGTFYLSEDHQIPEEQLTKFEVEYW